MPTVNKKKIFNGITIIQGRKVIGEITSWVPNKKR